MSAASSQVRQSATATARAQGAQRVAHPAPMYTFVSSEIEDEFRLNLSDIPRQRESLDVEGLKPSLLSRLLQLIAPIKA